jgi:hypothetical protein
VNIIYNNGQLSMKIGDNELISEKQNLMDKFGGWAYLGFSATTQDNFNRDYNVVVASICESDILDEVLYYWLVNGNLVTGPQPFPAGSTQKLVVGLKDSAGNNVPHFAGQNVMDLKMKFDTRNMMTVLDMTILDVNFLSYSVRVPKIVGDYSLSIQIVGKTGKTLALMKIQPKGFQNFIINQILNVTFVDPVLTTLPENPNDLFVSRTFSWDFTKNKQYKLLVETQDDQGNYYDM